ncbi:MULTISPECIES: hypothetical protein [unclassified Streptomyces]|uniref:ATP dependent DNA ligase n=1 Tax=unclassified Streptomyces TaxID=2593676 RepID=UPI00352F0F3A
MDLLACARRLGLSLNTVKRYARATEPDRMVHAPVHRSCLVDPYRDHLRKRRTDDPAVPVTHLLSKIREQGYTGSANLLVRYINQGRVEANHASLSPRKVTGLLTRHPDPLDDTQRALRDQRGGQEFVIGGFTEHSGSRIGFDALLLGHHDEDGRLRYAGKVGTGFDTDTLRKLRGRYVSLCGASSHADPYPATAPCPRRCAGSALH